MSRTAAYKQLLFYIVETEDEFIKRLTKPLYRNRKHRILRVVSYSDDRNFIRIAGSQDERIYETTVQGFAQIANILNTIIINPN